MRHVVRGVFHEPDAAQLALDAMMQQGIETDRVAFRSRFATEEDRELGHFPVFDTLGAAVLSERMMSTLSSTGFNLAGNSSLIDMELGDMGRLLEEMARTDWDRPPVRIDVAVQADDLASAERVRSILQAAGAHQVRIRPRD